MHVRSKRKGNSQGRTNELLKIGSVTRLVCDDRARANNKTVRDNDYASSQMRLKTL